MKTLIALLLMTSAAVAQTAPDNAQITVPKDKKWQSVDPDNMPVAGIVPATPTAAQKIEAFKKAYERRDKEVSEEVKADILQKVYKSMSGGDDAHAVKTEKIIPVAKAEDLNDIDRSAKENLNRLQRKWVQLRRREFASNVCEEHSMHKVVTRGGKSWRCR